MALKELYLFFVILHLFSKVKVSVHFFSSLFAFSSASFLFSGSLFSASSFFTFSLLLLLSSDFSEGFSESFFASSFFSGDAPLWEEDFDVEGSGSFEASFVGVESCLSSDFSS